MALENLRGRFGSIAPVEIAPGVAAWVLLSYDLNQRVLRDPAGFPRDPRRWREAREGRATPETVPGPFWYFRNALASDEPDHSRYRAVIADALAAITASGARLAVREITAELLAEKALSGRCDLVADFAFHLPLLLLNGYFGLPREQGARLVGLMRRVWDGGKDAEAARLELFGYAQAVTVDRRARPGTDIVSRMVAHPHGLDDEEVAHQLILVISAAHDPLMNLIANAVHTLLADREFRSDVAGARTRIEEAIDAVLWRSPPITLLPGRYPTRDMELAGARLREGDCLIIGYGPAHADPVVAPKAGPVGSSGARTHLAFGTGPHRCPARDLARQIGVDAVGALLDLLPDLHLAVAPQALQRRHSPFAHGLDALPVVFTPTTIAPPASPSTTGAPSCPHAPTPSSSSPDRPAPRHTTSRRSARWHAWWSKVWRPGR
ncbi:cytochrome P450 [Spinactinospora alkalitolerans]|uniref:Cytochrome P450 n=1 Tax=Spinactinospora alkalitolerans TaxID=687207 RepID=A0A852U7Z2_9ACTN|nr:cytochrome P450 [Spinactinospora alkalitolerans]NYE50050.1 cytochrome P450 [Spinactinospora alkalitolerans]